MNSTTVTKEKNTAAVNERWRSAYGPNELVQRVRPKEDKGYIRNPHRGTTTFQRFNGDALYPGLTWDDRVGPVTFKPFDGNLSNPQYPETTISYCRWLWSVLEPEKGKFRWDIIDGTFKAARQRGQTVQMRIQPYIGELIPKWYWETGAKAQPLPPPSIPDSVWSTGEVSREPDHNDPKYLKHFGDIIRAFAKRYDGHPDLEGFDIAYGGGCGETGGNCTPATARKLVDVYLKSFKKSQLISMLGTEGCRHASKHKRVGWRADCLGDMHTEGMGAVPDGLNWNHMYDAYPRSLYECGVTDAWKTNPITLETCWTVGYWVKQGWDLDFILEQALKYHTSVFMPKSSFIPDAVREKVDTFDRRLGYRFVLRQVNLPLESKPGQKIPYYIWIENTGVAPIYREYTLALRFRQGSARSVVPLKADLRTWLPGDAILIDSATFPKSLKRGEVDVDIGIIDEANPATGRVLFAIEPRRDDRWHPLTKMDVV
jgi:hypothetical protein